MTDAITVPSAELGVGETVAAAQTPAAEASRRKQVLNVGSGPKADKKLFHAFRSDDWREVRLDIDPKVAPDIVGSMVDLSHCVPDGSYDAIWSSHNLEHLDNHDVPKALAEFVRVLTPSGFALMTCPDLMEIARRIVNGELETELYVSPAGPVTPLDVLYGCGTSISGGNRFHAPSHWLFSRAAWALVGGGGICRGESHPGPFFRSVGACDVARM